MTGLLDHIRRRIELQVTVQTQEEEDFALPVHKVAARTAKEVIRHPVQRGKGHRPAPERQWRRVLRPPVTRKLDHPPSGCLEPGLNNPFRALRRHELPRASSAPIPAQAGTAPASHPNPARAGECVP